MGGKNGTVGGDLTQAQGQKFLLLRIERETFYFIGSSERLGKISVLKASGQVCVGRLREIRSGDTREVPQEWRGKYCRGACARRALGERNRKEPAALRSSRAGAVPFFS